MPEIFSFKLSTNASLFFKPRPTDFARDIM